MIRPGSILVKGSYSLPGDPLVSVARLINTTARFKKMHPELIIMGSGYSYPQEWLPNIAQHVIRSGKAGFIGIGRMVLYYPEMIADVLAGKTLKRNKICRTCSRCTTASRYRLVSGCYLTDDFYRSRPKYKELTKILQSTI